MPCRRIAIVTACLLASAAICAAAQAQSAGGPRREKSRIPLRPIEPRSSTSAEQREGTKSERGGVRRTVAEGPAENGLVPVSQGAAHTAKVTRGAGGLPNEHGQLWREYDITPFTRRAADLPRPEQAIVDWILRETGYEVWHSEPVGVLSATPTTLHVYHTPEMQATVASIVDRFVTPANKDAVCGLRLVSVSNPNWRSRAPAKLSPIEVHSAGLQAWLLAKEDAAILLAELRKRGDFREYGSPQLLVPNGQPTVVSALRTRSFTQHLLPGVPGISTYEPRLGEVEEGIAVELTPLLSTDGAMIDALLKCNIDQVERIVPVAIEANAGLLTTQRTKIEVPQRTQIRVKETFRWSADEVLMVSLGMVPSPSTPSENLLEKTLPFPAVGPERAEVLMFIDSRGAQRTLEQAAGDKPARNAYRGRY